MFIRNRLLRALGPQDFAALTARIEPVALGRGDSVLTSNEPIEWAYFIEEGMVGTSLSGDEIEIGPIGREGVVGAHLLIEDSISPFTHTVHVSGDAQRLAFTHLKDLAKKSPAIAAVISRYVHFFNVQTAETAVVNARCDVEQRLARWILMCRDRSENDVLVVTHSAAALRTRRAAGERDRRDPQARSRPRHQGEPDEDHDSQPGNSRGGRWQRLWVRPHRI